MENQPPPPALTPYCWDGAPLLSPAESEVVRLIASGMTSKAIADTLGRSHKTIENQTHGALKKLKHQGIHRRVDLVRWALIVRL